MTDLNEITGNKENRNKHWTTKNSKDRSGIFTVRGFFSDLSKKQFHFSIWYFVISMIMLGWINNAIISTQEKLIDYSHFKKLLMEGKIKRIEMDNEFYHGSKFNRAEIDSLSHKSVIEQLAAAKDVIYKTVPVNDPTLVPLLDSLKVEYCAAKQADNQWINILLSWVLPFLIMAILWNILFRRMGNNMGSGVMSFSQNKARLVAEGDTQTTFKDIAGVDEAKVELAEVVDFLKNPGKYTEIGGKIPKGVLLVGPPGTGKTLLARAVAGEAKAPFFRMSGADFVEMFVGVGAARVRDLFRQAKEKSPCIIFIDELDAIGKSRSPVAGGNDEREQTLNQLLVEMDGFDSRTGVIILAATNRPEILDPALLRPGRFDRQVLVDRPNLAGREAILKIHSKNVALDESVDLNAVARITAGFAGADLANIVNEAALLAVREGRKKVLQKDFDEALEKVMAGLQKKNRLINIKERQIVAYHETGHALTATFTTGADLVQKISIVPRGLGALGYTIQLPTEDRYLIMQDELLGKVDVLLGGRAAEYIVFGKISTGGANDIDRATDIVRRMLTEYGMGERFGNMVLRSNKGPSFLGDTGTHIREYSEATQQYIDEQTAKIIDERYKGVITLLKGKRMALDKIAETLLEKESLDSKEFFNLVKNSIPENVRIGA